ncbi:MAG: protein kinase [Burkholderiales bacterium]|jgi:serine/threonine protein phosphatase PrpC|nr:protein kinase [Burkholderiales bacterium]
MPLTTPALLQVRVGQHSNAGRKSVNQDFHGACLPDGLQRQSKGVAVALADGIGSSDVSDVAAAAAVHALLVDYYCTSDAWSVKRSAQCVIAATNSWLHAQTRRSPYRFDQDRGYVCTLSALIIKGATAHLFHVGDTRIHRVQGRTLEQLTEDHRVCMADGRSYLGRALGVQPQTEIDYRSLPVDAGDVFVLSTDGVHEHVSPGAMMQAIAAHAHDLDAAARSIVQQALAQGSPDNCTLQIVAIDRVPQADSGEVLHQQAQQRAQLRLPPVLSARQQFEGYEIVRELHASHRSHVYLATALASGRQVVLKTPSIDRREDHAYLDRFVLEEWIARRIDSPHVLRPADGDPPRPREHLFVAMEYVHGQTLAQWMTDHPRPSLAQVRDIVGQVARGLQAFHRREMLHLDLRPENILIDAQGTVKIIDFGAVQVAGLAEAQPASDTPPVLGNLHYTAPECLLGEAPAPSADLYALGVLTYQMLTGRLPYGSQGAAVRTRADLRRLQYRSALDEHHPIPAWMDAVLERAVHPQPHKRQQALTEFVHDLHHPGAAYLRQNRQPLTERNPLLFWRSLSLLLGLAVVVLLGMINSLR